MHLTSHPPYPPVSPLVALVSLHFAEVLEEGGEGPLGEAEGHRGQVRVKHVNEIKTAVPLQPQHVHASAVQHLK